MPADPVRDRAGLGASQGSGRGAGQRGGEGGGRVLEHRGPLSGRDVPGGERPGQHGGDERPLAAQRRRPGDLPGEGVPDDDAGPVGGQPLAAREPGVGQRAAGRLQGEPVGRVGGPVGGLGDAEPGAVEVPSLQQGSPRRAPGGEPMLPVPAGVAAGRAAGPSGRHPAERAPPGQCALEQGQGVVRVREPAGQADDGDGGGAIAGRGTLRRQRNGFRGRIHQPLSLSRSRELHARPATSIVSPEVMRFRCLCLSAVPVASGCHSRRWEYATRSHLRGPYPASLRWGTQARPAQAA